jgi:ubiquinone/menaquinone biosynthesis C-methylase UbiE
VNAAQVREVQAFFASRAAGWEQRFAGDDPRFEQAVAELHPPAASSALDVGCGTGRALPFLRRAVGSAGAVVALDLTPEMIAEAHRLGRANLASLLVADGEALPFAAASFQSILAAGFVPHLADATAGLAELARVTAPGGRLAIFHPIGRATLAARHGGTPSEDDVVSPSRLPATLSAAGWRLNTLDDSPERYLALATRA